MAISIGEIEMAVKKSELYSSLWASCDALRGGMDASQYKDYILTLLFVKYVSDKFAGQDYADIEIPEGGSFADMVKLIGKKDIGEGINKVIAKLAEANGLRGVIDKVSFNDPDKLGKGEEMVEKLSKLIEIFRRPELDFSKNQAEGDDLIGDAYEYLMRKFATESGKSKGQFYTPAEVSRILAKVIGIADEKNPSATIYEPSMGSGAFLAHRHFGSSDAKFYGVELDSITGRISKQLYQKANIQVTGYENALLPDNYFDCVIGNVPFGNFQVNDPQYNRLHFPIHDYFFAKSIDKLRTGGIMAFITSSGTLDKKDDRARKYIAERCDLIGAVRLPNNAFKGSGTKIMTDVIFLQKRDTLRQQDEPWLHLAEDANGITMNRYFVEHPDMICGRMEIVAGPYGPTSTCQPIDPDAVDRFGKPLLETQIDTAMQHLTATLTKAEISVQEESGEDTKYIDADPFVRNFSYTVKDDKIYYREGAVMRECNPNAASAERIRKLVELRDTTRALIDAQLQDLSDEEIHRLQALLNRQYDAFRSKHGLINSRSAESSFRDDSSYYLARYVLIDVAISEHIAPF